MCTAALLERLRERDQTILSLTKDLLQTLGENAGHFIPEVIHEKMEEIRKVRLKNSMPELAQVIARDHGVGTEKVLEWYNQFIKLKGFPETRQGRWLREWILHEDDLLFKFKVWLKSTKQLSVLKACNFLNLELLPNEGLTVLLNRYKITLPIAPSTAHAWLLRAGARYESISKSYYTDGHEKKDVVEDRRRYLNETDVLSLRLPLWLQVPQSDLSVTHESQKWEANRVHHYINSTGVSMVEFHVDKLQDQNLREKVGSFGGNWSVRRSSEAATKCRYDHDPLVCKCSRQAYHIGQDESIYKAYLAPSKEWSVGGLKTLRKKHDGPGEMVSGFQDEVRGFGFPMTSTELENFNLVQKGKGKAEIAGSPGLAFLSYGKQKEGYWNFEKLASQTSELIDVFEFLYPELQLIGEFDWSSGHADHKVDGLNPANMNATFGGKQKILRNTVVLADCLGEQAAIVKFDGRVFDLKLKPGEVQSMIFLPGDPPPFYDLACPEQDQVNTKKPTKKITKAGRKKREKNIEKVLSAVASTGQALEEVAGISAHETLGHLATAVKDMTSSAVSIKDTVMAVEEVENIKEGYMGKAKGKKQVLFERGLWKPKMTADNVDPLLNMDTVLAACGDFQREKTALEAMFSERGHILLMSVKYHPS
eukprot:Pompholyxophrys_punicea_v1_NODE_18_length_5920_cov_44.741176.p1 type:complete len:649 gc:universal NODE_18_length_5920_cov_44.741176:695-2641(+)